MKKLALAGLALLIVLAAVAPWVTGSVTESAWQEMTAGFNRSSSGMARLETLEYDRGYLATDILSRLTVHPSELEEPVEVYLRSGVSHGLTSARVESRLDSERHERLLTRFPDQQPLLNARARLSGNLNGNVLVPAFEQQEDSEAFRFERLEGEFHLEENGDRTRLALTWGGFRAEEGPNRLELGAVSLAEDMSRLKEQIWVGDLSFSIAGLAGRLPDTGEFALDQVTLVGTSRETGDERLESQLDVGIEQIGLGGEPYGDLRLQVLAEEVDSAALNQLMLTSSQLNVPAAGAGSDDPGERAVQELKHFGEMMAKVRQLMARGMRVAVPELVMNTPDGPVEADFYFAHPQLDEAQQEAMFSLLQHSEGGLNLGLPAAVAEQLPMTVQQQLVQLYRQGLIEEQDGRLKLQLQLEQMTLIINGQPVPIPPLI